MKGALLCQYCRQLATGGLRDLHDDGTVSSVCCNTCADLLGLERDDPPTHEQLIEFAHRVQKGRHEN
jgi:hypothetical protein